MSIDFAQFYEPNKGMLSNILGMLLNGLSQEIETGGDKIRVKQAVATGEALER